MDNYIQARCRHDTGTACATCERYEKRPSRNAAYHKCLRYRVVAFQEFFNSANPQDANLALRRLQASVLHFIEKHERKGASVDLDYRPDFDYSILKPCEHIQFDPIGKSMDKPQTRKRKRLTTASTSAKATV